MVKVSVVMAVYNGEKYLKKAIDSILNQTFKDFEFLIINDGSSDKSIKILESYAYDSRIRVLDNISNKGLIYSLNKGFSEAKGKYIARMDADDISYLDRFEKQVKYMELNTAVNLLGGNISIIFEGIPLLNKKYSVKKEYEEIKLNSFIQSQFAHPSIMLRREYIVENNLQYEEKYKNNEDFAFWSNIIPFSKVANLDDEILKYRVVKKSITREANKDMNSRREIFKLVYKNYFNNMDIDITENELDIHFEICMVQNLNSYKYSIFEKENYLIKLKKRLIEKGFEVAKVDKVVSTLATKSYIHQLGNLKNVNKELVNIDYGVKKAFLIEVLKKKIKRIYK